ncbi:MAG: NUDIX hydrolase [Gammaproteobacteria bacterium]|nr:MAG: NUDIX hydrolase [Gammaproteobacteria bacterium]
MIETGQHSTAENGSPGDMDFVPGIRNTVRALIIKGDHVLLLEKSGAGDSLRYALPGGGQDLGETLEQALQRECLEEIGASVRLCELLHVADFFRVKEIEPPLKRHLVEFVFLCQLPDDYSPQNGHHPDKSQIRVVWMPLDKLGNLTFTPHYLPACITRFTNRVHQNHYLGEFNDDPSS